MRIKFTNKFMYDDYNNSDDDFEYVQIRKMKQF